MEHAKNTNKIIGIGKNYATSLNDLANATPTDPIIFLKPHSTILDPKTGSVLIPKNVLVYYEVEIAVVVGKTLTNLPSGFSKEDALKCIDGYYLALDMTAWNVLLAAIKKGLPWTIAKGFDTFLPLSKFIPASRIPDPYNVTLKLDINNETKQLDNTNLMLSPIHKLLSYASNIMTLEKGDIILTGTPKGAGPVKAGDNIVATLSVDDKILQDVTIEVKVEDSLSPYVFNE